MSKVFDHFIDELDKKTGYGYCFLVDKFDEYMNNPIPKGIDKFVNDAVERMWDPNTNVWGKRRTIMATCPNCGGKLGYLNGDLDFPYAYGCDDCGRIACGYNKKDAKELFETTWHTSIIRNGGLDGLQQIRAEHT